MTAPRIVNGTNRPHTVDVDLSDGEIRALLAMCENTELRPAQVLRQALRVYQASRLPPDEPGPFPCRRKAAP